METKLIQEKFKFSFETEGTFYSSPARINKNACKINYCFEN
jgi:hypothetical protein